MQSIRAGLVLLFFLASVFQTLAVSQDESRRVDLDALRSRLKYQSGSIQLRDGIAIIKLTENFRYLDPAGTETLLTGIWGNPASQAKILGAIVPSDFDPFDQDSWCVIIDYSEDGFVSDSDAEKINYSDLLKKMKQGTQAANEERKKNGYPSTELVGWAAEPYYDKETHKFYWAKEIKFEGAESDNTLNYNIRILGRRGVLVLNVVARMAQLKEVESANPTILTMVNFTQGNTYKDYIPGTDKLASYGLGALVAGGLLAKTGLLKWLLASVLAFKKFIVIGLVALFAFIKSLFVKKPTSGGKSDTQSGA